VVGASFDFPSGRGLPAGVHSGFWQHLRSRRFPMPSANCERSSPPNKYAGQREKFLPDRNRRDSHGSDQRSFVPGSLTVKGRIL
jgi:hypothetical protein